MIFCWVGGGPPILQRKKIAKKAGILVQNNNLSPFLDHYLPKIVGDFPFGKMIYREGGRGTGGGPKCTQGSASPALFINIESCLTH